MLKQRNDERPKLTDTVSAFQEHEEDLCTDITEARQESMGASGPKKEAEADAHVWREPGRLFAVAEHDPNLRSSENFRKLQAGIATLEERIAEREELYHESVAIFSARIKQLPDVCFAVLLDSSEHEMVEAEKEDTEDTDVKARLAR